MEARIGNRARAGQVAGNFNTLIMLRVKELATAEMLTQQLPNVEIFSLMQVSGTNDTADPGSSVDFTSRNEDRISVSEVPLFTPADIVTLPKGQAFALLEGGQPGKLRMPLPDPGHDPQMPASLQQMVAGWDAGIRPVITGGSRSRLSRFPRVRLRLPRVRHRLEKHPSPLKKVADGEGIACTAHVSASRPAGILVEISIRDHPDHMLVTDGVGLLDHH